MVAMTNIGEVEDVRVERVDGRQVLVIEGSSAARPVMVEPTREGMNRLTRQAERVKPGDNSFRTEPPDEQADLVEVTQEPSDPSDDGDWLGPEDLADLDNYDPEDALEHAESQPSSWEEWVNPNDPSEW